MKINSVSSTKFGTSVKIEPLYNKKHPFLYNEILNLANEYGLPVNFKTKNIELPSVPVPILRKLNELKIRFKSR